MSTTYNYNLILEALNKHTGETFEYSPEGECFESRNFELLEINIYTFRISEVSRDFETGVLDYFLLGEDETLADAIDLINERSGESPRKILLAKVQKIKAELKIKNKGESK